MKLLILPLLLVAALIATHQPGRAHACTPPPMESQRDSYPNSTLVDRLPTVEQRAETAEIVLVGTVTELTDPQFYGTATVSVDFYLKAAGGPAEVEIGVFGSPSLCMSPVEVGGLAIFFAEGEPFSGSLSAHYSPWRDAAGEITPYRGQFNATASATAENVQIVADVAGQDPVLPGLAATTVTVTLVLAELPTPTTPPAKKPTPTTAPTPKPKPTTPPTKKPTPTTAPAPKPAPATPATKKSTPTAAPTPKPTPAAPPSAGPTETATPTEPAGEAGTSAPEPTAAKALPDERALADEDEEGSGGFCSAPTAGGGRTDLGLLGLLAGIAAFGFIRRVR